MKRVHSLLVVFGAVASALLLAGCGSGSSTAKVDPTKFTTVINNPFFPLTPNTTFFYEGTKNGSPLTDEFVVTSDTKVIQGVTCRVVRDKVFVNGKLEEDTLDWFSQDDKGNVWYFGEDTRELDENGVVVSRAGSFEAGVNGAQAGIIMEANPKTGDTYRQEFARSVAEDEATVLDLNSTASTPAGAFTACLTTKDFTRLKPDNVENKVYARGVGFVRGSDVLGGNDVIALTRITH